MAEALVSMVMEKIREALVSKVMEKLGEEVSSVGGAQAELEKISSTFESIQALLNDAEIMQFHNQSMQVWLQKLKDVAYDVEDLLDEMIPWPEPESRTDDGDNRQRMKKRKWPSIFSWTDGDDTDNRSIGDKVWNFFPTIFNKGASQRNFAHQIKEVSAKLHQIAADTSKFSFQLNHSLRGGRELHKAESQTSSLVDESQIHGRDKDRDTIISKLISGSSCEEGWIHVISIIGVGGLGKTTLVQLICNDERVRSHFHKVLWVCVSDDFNVINLTKAIIEAAGGTSPPHSHLDSLQKQLIQTLQDKLFLLVLDDVWNDDSERWERLWLSLQRGAPGSKILVTTRSEKVAITCRDSAYMHKLEGLSDDDCWLLFSGRAFAGRKVEDCLALEKMGREIVKKCKGVPLSAKVMGSSMRSKTSTQDWQNILESRTWEIPEIANGILPALLLSYYNLPLHLKPCFAYCSVFPKDSWLQKDRLVQLWLAQGFIKPQGRREMEAIGGEYFDDLLRRSLLQDAYVEYRETKYKMHDLLHDLIQFITKNECCIFENGKTDTSSVRVRHSSFIATRETSHIPAPLRHAKKLRTLIKMGYSSISTIPDNLFHCARSLRALDFSGPSLGTFIFLRSGRGIKELPSSIGLLKHLRYLDLSYSDIVELPEAVSSLRNLQTLKLNGCEFLQILPTGMNAMVRLRHLEIKETRELKYLPKGLGRISSLLTLSRFIVGGDGGCKIGELKRLHSLQGKLQIEYLERVVSLDEAKEAELEKMLHLRLLTLEMSGNGEVERMENVVEALRPPLANLEELEIRGYIGYKFPTWIGDYSSFSKLVKLKLIDCNKCTQLPGLGRLPLLKYLEIAAGLVKRVGSEFYGNSSGGGINGVAFPKLEELQFSNMYELEEWEMRLEDGDIMPSLRSLTINKCPKLKALPTHFPKSLTSLRIYEIFTVEFSGEILWPLPNLPSLKTFEISALENTTHLPNGWKQLESLETLTIRDCYKLRSLPDNLGQLKSLRRLVIFCCPELLSLPQGLQGLSYLEIIWSPMLAERCRGEEWSNISHIPNIRIDLERIK